MAAEKQKRSDTLASLAEFASLISSSLKRISFENKQKLLRIVLDQVVVNDWRVDVHYNISLPKPTPTPEQKVSTKFDLRSACTVMPWHDSYILGFSRRQYVYFVERQDLTTTIRQHVAAFTHLKGVAADCLYDNMKVVVRGHEGEQPIYNTRFLAFATYYGFRSVTCRPRRPETKGKIER